MIDLSGQVALITGGSRGIGAATAELFAGAGAHVAVCYRTRKEDAARIVSVVRNSGRRGVALKGDIGKFSDCRRIVSAVMKEFGRIDILVNNAGIWEEGSIESMTESQWKRTIRINLDGTFNMCRCVVPAMISRKYGRIINISSTAGQRGEARYSHYAATKGGIIAFTKSLAAELASRGILVNCVAPGWVETDMTSGEFRSSSARKAILASIPRGKAASPHEIAGPILFLASDLADNILGEILNVNGGSVLCG